MAGNAKEFAATIQGTKQNSVKSMAARKKLVELGAPPELLQRIQPHWQGNENQVMATYHEVKGNAEESARFKAAAKKELKKKKKK